MPRVSVDLDLDLASMSAAQMSLGCETLRVTAEQVAKEFEQLQQRHAGISVGSVGPIPQLGASTVDQVFEFGRSVGPRSPLIYSTVCSWAPLSAQRLLLAKVSGCSVASADRCWVGE